MNEELKGLVEHLETLEISLKQTQTEVANIRGRLQRISEDTRGSGGSKRYSTGRVISKANSHDTTPDIRDLDVGDRVRILNPVKLTGYTHPIHNCEGTIHRFTRKRFVIVWVYNKKRPAHLSGEYDEVRRERQNLKLIEVAHSGTLIREDEQF